MIKVLEVFTHSPSSVVLLLISKDTSEISGKWHFRGAFQLAASRWFTQNVLWKMVFINT